MSEQEIPVRLVQLRLCDLCLDGKGGECHTPGCSLWLNRAPDAPVRESQGVMIMDIAPDASPARAGTAELAAELNTVRAENERLRDVIARSDVIREYERLGGAAAEMRRLREQVATLQAIAANKPPKLHAHPDDLAEEWLDEEFEPDDSPIGVSYDRETVINAFHAGWDQARKLTAAAYERAQAAPGCPVCAEVGGPHGIATAGTGEAARAKLEEIREGLAT